MNFPKALWTKYFQFRKPIVRWNVQIYSCYQTQQAMLEFQCLIIESFRNPQTKRITHDHPTSITCPKTHKAAALNHTRAGTLQNQLKPGPGGMLPCSAHSLHITLATHTRTHTIIFWWGKQTHINTGNSREPGAWQARTYTHTADTRVLARRTSKAARALYLPTKGDDATHWLTTGAAELAHPAHRTPPNPTHTEKKHSAH